MFSSLFLFSPLLRWEPKKIADKCFLRFWMFLINHRQKNMLFCCWVISQITGHQWKRGPAGKSLFERIQVKLRKGYSCHLYRIFVLRLSAELNIHCPFMFFKVYIFYISVYTSFITIDRKRHVRTLPLRGTR